MIVEATVSALVCAARRLCDRGEISLEQYAETLRRSQREAKE